MGRPEPITGFRSEVRRWSRPPRGVSVVEYGIIIVLISLVVLAIIELFGGGIAHQLDSATNMIRSSARGESIDADETQRERTAAKLDDERAAHGGSARASSASGDEGLVDAPGVPGDRQAIRGERGARGSVGGINPIIILIIIAALILLGYAMFKDEDS